MLIRVKPQPSPFVPVPEHVLVKRIVELLAAMSIKEEQQ